MQMLCIFWSQMPEPFDAQYMHTPLMHESKMTYFSQVILLAEFFLCSPMKSILTEYSKHF